jgi:uncharacterized protein YijF (DUF1287 family)
MQKAKKIHIRKSQGFKIIVFAVIVLSAVQIWFLYKNYKEIVTKLPDSLYASPLNFPVSELTVNSKYQPPETSQVNGQSAVTTSETISLEKALETAQTTTVETTGTTTPESAGEVILTDVQKKIVLRLMALLGEDIQYGYKIFKETGYPNENTWISTDVIAVVLKDTGYDLMELINKDMLDHKEDYPLDIKNRKDPIKYIDFRDVFFQEQFFKRNALELEKKFIPGNKENMIQWQPGDIVYFQFDPENPYQDLGGFISSRNNDQGVPLVIMISKEFGKVVEVDKLQEYIIVGHYRYPNPYAGE